MRNSSALSSLKVSRKRSTSSSHWTNRVLLHEAIKSTMEVFKRNKGLAEKVSDVAEVSDRIEEVSANSREVLVTMDEFTQHVSNLRDIPSHLKSETDKLKVEG